MVIVILIFLAALAALGLPWSLTDCFVIVLDSKPSRPNRKLCKTDGVMKKHDLINKNTTTKTNAKTKTKTMTISFREYLQNASLRLLTFETFDQSDEKT